MHRRKQHTDFNNSSRLNASEDRSCNGVVRVLVRYGLSSISFMDRPAVEIDELPDNDVAMTQT